MPKQTHTVKTGSPAVRSHPFLAFFDETSAALLAEAAEEVRFPNGQVLFNEGDPADSIYLVLDGEVKLTKKDPAGKEQMLAIVKKNDYFGEFGVLDGLPRSASAATAGSDSLLVKIPRDVVMNIFDTSSGKTVMRLALHIIRKVRETNEKYVEERLRKERMTMIGEMADTIIHDLKNPFSVILLALDLMRRNVAPAAYENCDLIEAQVSRMQNMVEEILDFSRGSTVLNKMPMDVFHLFKSIEKLDREYLNRMKVEFILEPVSRIIQADERKLTRVLQNLIVNGAEAFGGNEGTIALKGKEQGDHLLISVSDNGPGIKPEMQSIMFEPFATRGKAKGTGLGMAIAKSIVEAHGGRIWFETAEGKGTTFFIELPC